MPRPIVPYQLSKDYDKDKKSCIYKMFYNDRYVIIKAKDHVQSVNALQKALNQFMRDSETQRNPDNLYFHFFSYIEKHKDGVFKVEIVLCSENQYELLKTEQIQLDNSKKDKKCLNNNVSPYIPLYDEEKRSYGWISKSAVLNFKKWLKSRPKNKQSQ